MRRLVLKSKSPFVTLHRCHLTIQSNTVSSFSVQGNLCKRQWVSNITEGPLKSDRWVLCSYEKKRETLHNSSDDQYFWPGLMTETYVKRVLICNELTLAACRKRYFSHLWRCEPPEGKYEQQGHVLSRAVFVATDGLSANIYMANTIKWKGAKETECKNAAAVKGLFPSCT